MGILNVTKDNYEEVIKDSAVLEFWLPQCEACEGMLDILSKLDINHYRVNADTELYLMEKYRIVGLPCVMYFNDSKVIGFRGTEPYEGLDKFPYTKMKELITNDVERLNLVRRN